jgi:hypothetical protein
MNENKMWYEILGGKRLTAVWIGLVLPLLVVITLAFISRIEMAYHLAETVGLCALGGIIAYITGNTIVKVKNGKDKK